MKNVILENIKWIFSGIGVVIVVGLWAYFKRRRKLKTDVIESYIEEIQQPIDPYEVVGNIKEAPILQQDGIAKHYEGIRVDWAGKLDYMAKWPENKLRVDIVMRSKDPPPGRVSIAFFIDPNEYAGLGLLKKGDPIRVSGVIDQASSVGFILKDAKLISYGSGHQ